MNASEINKLIIDSLREALDKMRTSEWDKETKKLSKAEREKASLLKISCHFAQFSLVNIQLEAISDKLQANEDELKEGTDRLNKALDDLKEVKAVIDAASSLLSVVTKVVGVV
jgi:hypothetical protein